MNRYGLVMVNLKIGVSTTFQIGTPACRLVMGKLDWDMMTWSVFLGIYWLVFFWGYHGDIMEIQWGYRTNMNQQVICDFETCSEHGLSIGTGSSLFCDKPGLKGYPFKHGTIWLFLLTVCHGKSPFLIGKPYINGPFSMAMSNNQRVPLIFPGKYGGSAHG